MVCGCGLSKHYLHRRNSTVTTSSASPAARSNACSSPTGRSWRVAAGSEAAPPASAHRPLPSSRPSSSSTSRCLRRSCWKLAAASVSWVVWTATFSAGVVGSCAGERYAVVGGPIMWVDDLFLPKITLYLAKIKKQEGFILIMRPTTKHVGARFQWRFAINYVRSAMFAMNMWLTLGLCWRFCSRLHAGRAGRIHQNL